MTNDAQQQLNQIVKKERMFYLDLCNRDLVGEMNLGEFINLKNINASNNKFTNLNFLLTLPNKNELEKINFFGNEINEVDFMVLFTNFPNLKTINLDNNPLSLKNLDKLSPTQMAFLAENVENKKIKISSWKGTIVLDLLKQIQELKEKLARTNTTNYRETPFQHQKFTNDQRLPEKPNNNYFGLFITILVFSCLVGSLFTFLYFYLIRKRKKI